MPGRSTALEGVPDVVRRRSFEGFYDRLKADLAERILSFDVAARSRKHFVSLGLIDRWAAEYKTDEPTGTGRGRLMLLTSHLERVGEGTEDASR